MMYFVRVQGFILCAMQMKKKKRYAMVMNRKTNEKFIGNVAMSSQIEVLLFALQFNTHTETTSQLFIGGVWSTISIRIHT